MIDAPVLTTNDALLKLRDRGLAIDKALAGKVRKMDTLYKVSRRISAALLHQLLGEVIDNVKKYCLCVLKIESNRSRLGDFVSDHRDV